MKRLLNQKSEVTMIVAMMMCLLLQGCSARRSDRLPDVDDAVALFGYFNYKGEDDIYINNPLPDDESFYNPVLPGWYSDPSVCSNGKGDYFMVNSTFSYYPGVPIFHSRDLVNWRQVGHVLSRPSQLDLEGQGVSGGIYAASISYNKANDTYYMVTTNVGTGNFFVKTKDPFGEWSDPIRLPSVGGIDPSFFFDDDGRAYIVNNEDAPDNKPEYDGHRTIRVQEFDVAADSTVGPRKIIVNKGSRPEEKPIWIEGPHMYKINGRYLLMCAEGGTGDGHSEVVFSSDSPMGEFIPWSGNPILTQRNLDNARPNPVTCAGHADIVQSVEGDWWACFLACRPINNKFENLGRETFFMPLKWSSDGFPVITAGEELVPTIVHRQGVKRGGSVTFGNFSVNDDFSSDELGDTWMTLRSPITDQYSLTDVPGYLKLKCTDISLSDKSSPSYVCRRMQHHKFECDTRMLFNPKDSTERAGIALFKDEQHQYLLVVGMDDGRRTVSVWQIAEGVKYRAAVEALDDDVKCVDLKVVSRGTYYDFYYSTGGGRWKPLCKNIDALYLSTALAGGFTGTTIGLYATTRL